MKNEETSNGGPAFPGPCQSETSTNINEGMSMLDWFAGMAMQGLLASENANDTSYAPHEAAEMAYSQAMEMLAVRERLNPTEPDEDPEPAPVESPEDWVEITDPEHVVRKCDQCNALGNSMGGWLTVGSSVGSRVANNPTLGFRCRRRDLPPTASQQWISVTDQLPEQGKDVLFCCQVGKESWFVADIGQYNGNQTDRGTLVMERPDSRFDIVGQCSHWMPVPTTPKSKDNRTATAAAPKEGDVAATATSRIR